MKFFYLFFLLVFHKTFLIHAMKIFCLTQNDISPITLNCPGEIVSNFMLIIDSNIDDDIVVLLTKDSNGQDFFFMLKEYQNASSPVLLYDKTNSTGFQNFNVKSITIAPFYCNQYKVTDCCYDDGETPIIYFKSDNFTITASSYINISNVIFDGSDIVEKINIGASGLQQCTEMRQRCCIKGTSTLSDIQCTNVNQTGVFKENNLNGLFSLKYVESVLLETPPGITITNTVVQKFNLYSSSSFFLINAIASNITINNLTMSNSVFAGGFISISNSSSLSSQNLCDNQSLTSISCQTSIDIQNSVFKEFNAYGLTKSNFEVPDGYILRLNITHYSIINLNNNIFTSMMTTINATCPISSDFEYPNIFNSSANFASNLLLQHTLNYQPALESSAILIESLTGTMTINNNTFSYIVGYSGSALAVNGLSSTSNIIISNNIFSNNFAIMNGASIRIITYTSNYMESDNCGRVTLENNSFINNIGCSLAYGNVLLICSGWTSLSLIQNLPNSLLYPSVFIDDTSSFDNTLYNHSIRKPIIPQININNNNFQGNYLSLSNCLAIHGYSLVSISNNSFTQNGVLIAEFGTEKIANYLIFNQTYFQYSIFDKTAFLESSPLFISAASYLQISSNTFSNNWAVYSCQNIFGSQITLREIVILDGYFTMVSNIFENNYGIDLIIASQLTDKMLKIGNGITPPLITISSLQLPLNFAA